MKIFSIILMWLVLSAPAKADYLLTHAGTPPAAASYVGPGDLKPGATAWYSCAFAYSAAYAASLGNACGLTRSSDSATCIEKVSENGLGDVTVGTPCNSAASGTCSVSLPCTVTTFCLSTTCHVTTLYDQTGNGVTQTCTATTMVLSSPFPTIVIASGAGGDCSGTISSTPQPITFSAVAKEVGPGKALMSTYQGIQPLFDYNAANTIRAFTGNGNFTTTFSDGSYHSGQAVFNGASSSITVDGGTTTGSLGAPISTSTVLEVGSSGALDDGSDNWGEGGMWPVAFSGSDLTAVGHNECTRWGLSC